MPDDIISPFKRTFNRPMEVDAEAADIPARDAITTSIRFEGMVVFVQSAQVAYQLKNGITNTDWVVYGGTGVNGTFTSNDSKTITVTNGLITSIV